MASDVIIPWGSIGPHWLNFTTAMVNCYMVNHWLLQSGLLQESPTALQTQKVCKEAQAGAH